jgi:hypothetical protein
VAELVAYQLGTRKMMFCLSVCSRLRAAASLKIGALVAAQRTHPGASNRPEARIGLARTRGVGCRAGKITVRSDNLDNVIEQQQNASARVDQAAARAKFRAEADI